MNSSINYPKLRWPLDVRYQSFEKEHVLVLSCPIGLVEQPLVLVAGVGQILADYNGQLSLADLHNKYKVFGITPQILTELTELLDKNYFLESDRYHQHAQTIRAEYQISSLREAFLAGIGYPANSHELGRALEKYLQKGNSLPAKNNSNSIIGLAAPHIDYQRGSDCYGITYSNLKKEEQPLIILLGTAHQYSPYLFHLTAKDFETPFGKLDCDNSFVSRLANVYGPLRSFADEILYKREHSLEYQLPFIKYLNPNAKIVPILVGSFHNYLLSGKEPSAFPEYADFAAALVNITKEKLAIGTKVIIVAGVDMAHVGRQFGDKFDLTEKFMTTIAVRDNEYIQTIIMKNKQKLYEHIASDNDARRICGYPCMYLMLDILEQLGVEYQVECFDYRQAVDYKSGCAVTFAGFGFYG